MPNFLLVPIAIFTIWRIGASHRDDRSDFYGDKGKHENIFYAFMHYIGLWIFWPLLFFEIAGCAEDFSDERLPDQKDQIVSINRGSDIYGSFTLGCGSVQSFPAYYFYYPHGGDTYTLGSVLSIYVKIHETDDEPGLRYAVYKQSDYYNYFFNGSWFLDNGTKGIHISNNPFMIDVPHNTIIQRFELQ